MAIILTVNTVDKTNQIDWRSIRKQEVLSKEPDTLEFSIKNYGTKTYQPSLNDEVVWYDTDGVTKKFAGYVVEMNENMIGGLAQGIKVICKDYTETLDRQLVSKVYENMTVNAIIADLITTFAPTFTTVAVSCTVNIELISFNYIPVSKCLEKLTQILGNFEWYVDYSKDIHFFQSASVAAPFGLTDTSANFFFDSLVLKDKSAQIRNEIIVRGGEIESATLRTEYFDGDGTKAQWALANKFSSLPTVTVGGVGKTVGVEFLDEEASFQFMWEFNSQSLRATAGNIPPAGTRNLVVTGYPLYPLILIKRNEPSIALYGVHQYILVDKNIRSVDVASKAADAQIAQYGVPSKSGSFSTLTGGLRAGQYISINSTIRSLNQSYKIRSITTVMHTPTSFRYDVMVETGNEVGIQDVLTKLLVTNPSDQIAVSENEVIQRYYGFSETLGSSDSVSAPTKTSPPYVYGTAKWGLSTWS